MKTTRVIFGAVLAALVFPASAQFWRDPGGIANGGTFNGGTTQIKAPDGAVGAPSYSFSTSPSTVMYWDGTNLNFATAGVRYFASGSAAIYALQTTPTLAFGTGGLQLANEAANVVAQKNTTNAQEFRVYGTTTGPKYLSLSSSATDSTVNAQAGVLTLQSGGNTIVTLATSGVSLTRNLLVSTGGTANQVRIAQTTSPTCSSNCGTSPSVSGTDTAGIVTMGSSGAPTSGWVVTFNGTWPAAPSCIVQMAKAGMVVGKMPLTVVTSTTTFTVVTNGTAPATTDVYAYHCFGVN